MKRFSILPVIAAFLFAVSAQSSAAVELLRNVPPDALGFVIMRDIGASDAKVQQLMANLQSPFGGPVAFLQAVAGIRKGLDLQGDMLLAVVPDNSRGAQPKFCIWLPVADYNAFVASLGSKPAAGITAVTIVDVDLLVARHGKWALVMDPDERERMERMLAAQPVPPKQVAAWQDWIESNDVTAVALAGGMHDLLSWALTPTGTGETSVEGGDNIVDNPFGPADAQPIAPQDAARQAGSTDNLSSKIRSALRKSLMSSPRTLQWAHAIEAIGCGARLDDEGNVLAGMRAVWSKDGNFAPNAGGSGASLPPSLFDSGQYVVLGAGNLPQPLTAVLAGAYVRLLVDELKTEMGLALDSSVVVRFQDAVEQAAADVPSAGVLSLAGGKDDGVYTNNFLVVRSESAETFAAHVNEVMRLWNQMNREADEGTRLVFDVEELPAGGHIATHYTIDIAAADGTPMIPEVRQAMEKLFGAGGKMRLIVAPADDHNVLLAMATPEQAQQALKTLQSKQSNWEGGEKATSTGTLLPRNRDWRLFISPHGYNIWLSRQMDAMTGPVIGGPIVKPFPDSPPIGVVGGARDYELWIDAAAAAHTIQSAGKYLKAKRTRNRP